MPIDQTGKPGIPARAVYDVDIKLFNRIKIKWSFYSKIKYLKDQKLIPEPCFIFLNKLKNIRNKIHEDPLVYGFSEKDLELFSIAHNLSANLHSSTFSGWSDVIKNNIISNCENAAAKQLERI
jgi:hypothetical protein